MRIKKKGFWQVQVEIKEEPERYFIVVNEGPRSLMRTVSFEGLLKSDQKKLEKLAAPLCNQLFDEDLLKKVIYDCQNYLLQQGYIHGKIVEQFYKPELDGSYCICMKVAEGERFFIQEIILPEECADIARLLFSYVAGCTPFDPTALLAQRQALLDYMHQRGYLYAQVNPAIIYEGNLVSIMWRITNADQPLRFGKIIVQGAARFPVEYVLRELDFKEGTIWQKEKIERAALQLRKLGIFDTIQVQPYNIAAMQLEKPIVITLQEDDPFEVRVRAGFQQVSKNLTFRAGSTYKIGGTFLYKNPLNQADCLSADFDVTRFYQNFSLVYRRPWILGQPIATLFKVYNNKYIQPIVIGSDKPLYRAIQQGFLVALTRSWAFADFGINIGIEGMETNDLSIEMAQAINFEPVLIDRKFPYFFCEPNLVINYLDNQLNPTRGTLSVLSLKTMLPWKKGTVNFFKIIAEQSGFIPLGSAVLGMRLRFGHIFNQDFKTIMPPERFYLGGYNSIRSYEPDFGPPLGSFINHHGKMQLVPQGGKTMVNANIELRFPLLYNIGAVIFQDLGTLIERSFTEVVRGNRLLAGTGFGLRYNTPVGPLRFDIGWKWRRRSPEDSIYAWFLTLGQAF